MKHISTCAAALLMAAPALAQDYPLTIAHKFGSTTIEEKPTRVASLDFNGADNLLAFGVQPVTVRHWYGDFEQSIWPWASELLTSQPEILKGALNYEQIAAAEPDVIIAIWSGISDADYQALSRIAPVVAVPEGVGDYALPWDDLALLAGRAAGVEDQATEQVAHLREQMADMAARHPDWAGKTASVAYFWDGTPGAYTAQDLRPQLLSALGFTTPDAITNAAKDGAFALSFSEEELEMIDADVLIWITDGSADQRAKIDQLALRPALRAHQQGREILTDTLLTGALSHASLLSLPYALNRLEPMIEAAIDGTPETAIPD